MEIFSKIGFCFYEGIDIDFLKEEIEGLHIDYHEGVDFADIALYLIYDRDWENNVEIYTGDLLSDRCANDVFEEIWNQAHDAYRDFLIQFLKNHRDEIFPKKIDAEGNLIANKFKIE